MAVPSTIDGGEHNLARADLNGAQVGLSGIPERFMASLTDYEHLLDLAGCVDDTVGNEWRRYIESQTSSD